MNRTSILLFVVLLIAGSATFLWTSFADKKPRLAKADVIQLEVEERLRILIENRRERCRTEALDKATAIVDSMLIEQAKANKDTLGKPPKPLKPVKPEILSPIDSLPVRPFLQRDTSRQVGEN